MPLSPEDFGATFQSFMKHMAEQAPAQDPFFGQRLRTRLSHEPATLPVVSETFPEYQQPDIQLALDGWLADHNGKSDILGVIDEHAWFGVSLSRLVAPKSLGMMGGTAPVEGPVQYVNLSLDGDNVLTCVQYAPKPGAVGGA
jgi:hypothetical protein